jgi:hypothetical protein
VAVGVQVKAQGVVAVAGIGVLLHETRRDRVVHAGVQIVEPCFRIVLVSGVEDVIGKHAVLIEDVAERVVVVRRDNGACCRKKRCDIRMSVIHVNECIHTHLTGQEVDTVDVAAGLVSQAIYFEHDSLVFIQVSGQCAVDGFTDTQAISVIGVDDRDGIGRHGLDQLVKEVIGIGELHDGSLRYSIDIGGMGLEELVAVVVVGVDDGLSALS